MNTIHYFNKNIFSVMKSPEPENGPAPDAMYGAASVQPSEDISPMETAWMEARSASAMSRITYPEPVRVLNGSREPPVDRNQQQSPQQVLVESFQRILAASSPGIPLLASLKVSPLLPPPDVEYPPLVAEFPFTQTASNVHNTAFAGAIFSVVSVVGWAAAAAIIDCATTTLPTPAGPNEEAGDSLGPCPPDARSAPTAPPVVLRSSNIQYHRPVTRTTIAVVTSMGVVPKRHPAPAETVPLQPDTACPEPISSQPSPPLAATASAPLPIFGVCPMVTTTHAPSSPAIRPPESVITSLTEALAAPPQAWTSRRVVCEVAVAVALVIPLPGPELGASEVGHAQRLHDLSMHALQSARVAATYDGVYSVLAAGIDN